MHEAFGLLPIDDQICPVVSIEVTVQAFDQGSPLIERVMAFQEEGDSLDQGDAQAGDASHKVFEIDSVVSLD